MFRLVIRWHNSCIASYKSFPLYLDVMALGERVLAGLTFLSVIPWCMHQGPRVLCNFPVLARLTFFPQSNGGSCMIVVASCYCDRIFLSFVCEPKVLCLSSAYVWLGKSDEPLVMWGPGLINVVREDCETVLSQSVWSTSLYTRSLDQFVTRNCNV